MKLLHAALAALALLLTAQTAPPGSDDATAVVVARPVKVVKSLVVGEGGLVFFQVKMEVQKVLHGRFKRKYFHAVIPAHLPQYVFLTPKWVAVIDPHDRDGVAANVARIKERYCFADETVDEYKLKDRLGSPYRVSEHPDGACWDLRSDGLR